MFLNFFYILREKKIPVSTTELFDLIKTVTTYLENNQLFDLKKFYNISRSCLVKDIKYYYDFELVFNKIFSNLNFESNNFMKHLANWLAEFKKINHNLPPSIFDQSKLFEEFLKRLQEQKKEHNGGNYWIGTGGSSPFGNSGTNPNGIRMGGSGGGKTALFNTLNNNFQEYRNDEILNVRNIKIALKSLRLLKKEGKPTLSIRKTIDETCRNYGEIEPILENSKKNNLKLILLMDTGGSMTPYTNLVNKLFSASHQLNHFKEFNYYYFHNIIYDSVFTSHRLNKRISLNQFFKLHSKDSSIIFIGDALMSPFELFDSGYNFYNNYFNSGHHSKSGLETLISIQKQFKNSIWLNPEEKRYWNAPTIMKIKEVVPMFNLTLEGIHKGIKHLIANY